MFRRTAQFVATAALVVAFQAAAGAQVMSRPAPPPVVVADNEDWYRSGEPIAFAGALYYRVGAMQHFNGNRMFPTGGKGSVTFYVDVFLDPLSKIFVPVSGGLMQPYERRRDGDLAGTTGSQAPSFPVAIAAESPSDRIRAGWPGAVTDTDVEPADAPADLSIAPLMEAAPATPVGTAGTIARPARGVSRDARAFAALEQPTGVNAVFILFEGIRWQPAGPAVAFNETEYRVVGDYRGFPVFADDPSSPRAGAKMIYLPSRSGMLTPYVPLHR
jgi:hypothetical protein